jgi:tetratricopeptide (TPR) repeat protein
MKDVLKYILCFAGIILAVLAIYFGSYAPLHKAQLYIDALRQTSSVSTVKQFEDLFDPVFNFYSPIGNEEVPKFLSSDIVGILNSNRVGSEDVAKALVDYIEPHMLQDNVRHLLSLGYMYEALWKKFQKDEYYNKAESYYLKVVQIGPTLPPGLYSLANLYQERGDQQKLFGVVGKILQYWPDALGNKQPAPVPASSTASSAKK